METSSSSSLTAPHGRTWRHLLQTATLFRALAKKSCPSARRVYTDRAMNRITVNQARIFWHIFGSAGEGIRIKSLARDLGVSSAAVSQVVSRLVSARLLLRRPDPADRRAVVLSVAPRGRALLDEIDRRSTVLQEQVFGELGLPASDIEAFGRVVAGMHERLLARWRSRPGGPGEGAWPRGRFPRDTPGSTLSRETHDNT